MAKEATLQVRMDAELKEEAENLYREMGTSLAEAVRIFAKQSILHGGMPFSVYMPADSNTYGKLSKYAKPDKIKQEDSAFEEAMVEKYGISRFVSCSKS